MRSMSPQPLVRTPESWSYRVLVVDDEREIAEIIRTILQGKKNDSEHRRFQSSRHLTSEVSSEEAAKGVARVSHLFEVDIVTSADEALEAVQRSLQEDRPYALGFFDVVLGGSKDGFDLVKEIQLLDSQIYSVFVTAYNDRSIDSIDSYLGSDKVSRWDYMNKPFTEGEILQKARNFVSLWNLERDKGRYQQQLSEMQNRLSEMDRASAAAAVSRGMGHEFGNILMQIMGKADVSKNKSEKEMREALSVIIDACLRASDILDRFKDLSSEKSSSQPMQQVLMNEVLEETLKLLSHQFRAAKIKPKKKKVDKLATAYAHSTALLQVLVNLTINAIHAMPSGGVIEYSIVDQGEDIQWVLRDNGPGIPEEILPQVTEPFFTTKGDAGTGLGMAICKEIVEIEHQGHFHVYNHDDGGLCIEITIPKMVSQEVQSA